MFFLDFPAKTMPKVSVRKAFHLRHHSINTLEFDPSMFASRVFHPLRNLAFMREGAECNLRFCDGCDDICAQPVKFVLRALSEGNSVAMAALNIDKSRHGYL